MCAVIMAGAVAAAARKGANSKRSSSGQRLVDGRQVAVRIDVGVAVAGEVLDAAGHAFAFAAVHPGQRHAAAACGSAPKERSAMTGLRGLLFRSSTGAKFQLKPIARIARATAAPTSRASSGSPAAPSAIADGGGGTHSERTTAPPSWSSAIRALMPIASRRRR
jgi:hypothetical protein